MAGKANPVKKETCLTVTARKTLASVMKAGLEKPVKGERVRKTVWKEAFVSMKVAYALMVGEVNSVN